MENTSKCGLVIEGGGLRGMFAGGVLDALMENNIQLDGVIGVSSGALFGLNYKSRQPHRAYRYNVKYKDDKRYMSLKSWITTGNYVNAKFSYDTLPTMLDPFDYKTFMNNPMEFYITCTDIQKGEPVYRKIDIAEIEIKWIQATASLPILSKPVQIGDNYYLDGGMSDSIPLKKMQSLGYDKNIVILTQPIGYKKEPFHAGPLFKLWHHKFPKVAELMEHRHTMYNKQLEYVAEQQRAGKILVIAPKNPLEIGRVELNEKKMKAIYEEGILCTYELLPIITKFLK